MMSVEQIEAKIAELQQQRKMALSEEKGKDLALVKQLCKKHGFTARMLKGFIGEGRNRRSRAELEAIAS